MSKGKSRSNTARLFKTPIKSRVRVYEDIVSRIFSLIQSGELQVGDKLPPERELAESLQVSRSSVREALRSLELLGHIEVRPGVEGGSYVKEIGLENAQLILQSMFNLSQQSITDLIEVRLILESQAVTYAAERRTKENLNEIQASIEMMERELLNGDIGINGDHEFHCVLAKSTQNLFLTNLTEMLEELIEGTRIQSLSIPGIPQVALQEHKDIFEAIKNRDGKRAAFLMREHLTKAYNISKGEPVN